MREEVEETERVDKGKVRGKKGEKEKGRGLEHPPPPQHTL